MSSSSVTGQKRCHYSEGLLNERDLARRHSSHLRRAFSRKHRDPSASPERIERAPDLPQRTWKTRMWRRFPEKSSPIGRDSPREPSVNDSPVLRRPTPRPARIAREADQRSDHLRERRRKRAQELPGRRESITRISRRDFAIELVTENAKGKQKALLADQHDSDTLAVGGATERSLNVSGGTRAQSAAITKNPCAPKFA
jgi:hypothetical protein